MNSKTVFKAQTQWFRIFKEMIDSGAAAALGPHTFIVYSVIKSHSNFETGISFPAIETIRDKSGISLAQVKRCLKKLEIEKYIKKEKKGRCNTYMINEFLKIQDDQGNSVAQAQWTYLPLKEREVAEELNKILMTGKFDELNLIKVENLNINAINNPLNGININIQKAMVKAEEIQDIELKNQLQKMLAGVVQLYENSSSRAMSEEVIHSSDGTGSE